MVTKSKRKTNRTKPRKENYLRNAEYYDMQPTLDRLYAESKKGAVFDHLTEMIFSRENILLAYRNIKRNDGSVTPGTDGLKIKDVEKYSPEALVRRIRNITANYTPRAVRRKEIPKPNDPGKTRPLGIPCIWDRLIQQCIMQILEPICEARFSENSYGFRPNRSCEQAVAAAYRLMQRSHMHFVVDFDIKGFFDNVDHSKLLRQMWAMGIRDKRLLYLIKRILKAPILLENGTMITPDKGTPQGGIISPLLANIVLNELDWWVESQWQENPLTHLGKPQYNAQGVLDKSHGYRAMRETRLKEMYMVRYADDFRIFCPSMAEAVRTKEAVTMWLKERLRLDVSPEKTKVVNLHKGYSNFLGIKMRLRTKQDKLVVHSRVADKAVKRIKEQACQKMHDIAKPPAGITETQAIVRYNSFVMGEHNYYCMATAVSVDFRKIGFHIKQVEKRLGDRLKREPTMLIRDAVYERYKSSDMLRFIKHLPLVPISYVQTKAPFCKSRLIQKYTPEGRSRIHDDLGIPTSVLHALLRRPAQSDSTALADNRLSLFCAQYGKCAITGKIFGSPEEIHCHHKLPRHMGGNDSYGNLILVTQDVHILIHATNPTTIAQYAEKLSLNVKQLAKLNKLRKEAGNAVIAL